MASKWDLPFNRRPDLDVDDLEATWIELLPPASKSILVGAIYRQPSDNSFISKLESSLSKVPVSSELYLLGDFNIDLLCRNSSLGSKYSEVLDTYGCDQLISVPTRITPLSSTLIDHVVTNMRSLVQKSGVIIGGFSDHLITFCSRGMPKDLNGGSSNFKTVRSFKSYSKEVFNAELS